MQTKKARTGLFSWDSERFLPQAQQQILFKLVRTLLGEGVTLFTASAPAEATGFQHMGAQTLIHGHGELAALPLNGD
ncbi:hypothetical protein D3C75_509270 [compost metagenome]